MRFGSAELDFVLPTFPHLEVSFASIVHVEHAVAPRRELCIVTSVDVKVCAPMSVSAFLPCMRL